MRPPTRLLTLLFAALILHGCSHTLPPPAFDGDPGERAVRASRGDLEVAASSLSAYESLRIFGLPLASRGIQPVWVEVHNRGDQPLFLLSPGLDPHFFPASEVVDAFTGASVPEATRAHIDQRLRRLAFRNPIAPGTSRYGYLFSNIDYGIKLVQLDLMGNGRLDSFSLVTPVPGFRADYHRSAAIRERWDEQPGLLQLDDPEQLRAALRALPCCTSNRAGTRLGDPLNLVIVGTREVTLPALIRRGWKPTEATWAGSVARMVASALAGDRYPYAPISPLFLYGRTQDLALQKARDNIHQRNHLRLWLSPLRYLGQPVWVGQISRDIGTRLTIHSPYLTTHKIDPDVDEARSALMEDLVYSQNLRQIGLVAGVGPAPAEAPRGNLTTDPYYTDGNRLVLIFDQRTTSIGEIELLRWHSPGEPAAALEVTDAP